MLIVNALIVCVVRMYIPCNPFVQSNVSQYKSGRVRVRVGTLALVVVLSATLICPFYFSSLLAVACCQSVG